MKCPRCQGFLRWETIYGDSEKFDCLMCVNCGECLDLQIIKNRMESLAQVRSIITVLTNQELRKSVKKDWAHFKDRLLMKRVGKKVAGRLLDGLEWNEMPSTSN